MTSLTSLTLAEARDGLRAKKFSAREIAQAHVAAVERARNLNAFVLETPERALEMAAASDKRIAAGKPDRSRVCRSRSRISSAPKAYARQPARRSSRISFLPTSRRSPANLWRDGAVLLGKTNMDEFAMGSSNETSCFGSVSNPWRRKGSNAALVPGGSSGGSATAVAAQLCLGATGTDTGGSIRQPAAFTGTVGIKPTYGRCSRWGVVAFASSLDQAGPFARTVRDAAILLRSMSGHDPKDSTSADAAVPDFEAAVGKPIKGRKIGIPKEYRVEGMPAEIEKLWSDGAKWLKERRGGARRDFPAAHEICAAGLLHRCAGGSVVQSRAL